MADDDDATDTVTIESDTQAELIAEYERAECDGADAFAFPAWILCLSDVTNVYGQCPYLKLEHKENREPWLRETHDGGAVFDNVRARLIEKTGLAAAEAAHAENKQGLLAHVREQLVAKGISCPKDGDTIDYIVGGIRHYQSNSKSRTKVMRQDYTQILKFIDSIVDMTGMNLVIMLRLVHDISIKYKSNAHTANVEYDRLCDAVKSSHGKVCTEEAWLRRKRIEGLEKLTVCMRAGFYVGQAGRYFKRWTALTAEQKMERVKTFAAYHGNELEMDADSRAAFDTFLVTAHERGNIKTNMIKWSSKTGVIDSITGLVCNQLEGGAWSVQLSRPATASKKRVTFASSVNGDGDTTASPPRRAAPSRKTNVGTCSSEEQERLNRLLLDQLINDANHGRSKEAVVRQVLDAFSERHANRARASVHLNVVLDDMIDAMREHPMDTTSPPA